LGPNLFIQTIQTDPQLFFGVVITVIVSICIHELCHGIVAVWLGDRTPIESGHMTLNPVVHMGLQSLIVLAIAGIAWGQMPVNRARLRGRFGGTLVALAGPAANVILAFLALTARALSIRYGPPSVDPPDAITNLRLFLNIFGVMNVALAMFNLLPVPPLDGSNALAGLSPKFAEFMRKMRTGGQAMIVFIIIFVFAAQYIFDAAAIVSKHYSLFVESL
jgi:Zn-dependent protease